MAPEARAAKETRKMRRRPRIFCFSCRDEVLSSGVLSQYHIFATRRRAFMSEQPLRNEMHQYLDQIVTSQKYMLRQAEAELEKLNAYENPTAFELLCVRAFTHAYAGMNEAAISDLTALA